MCRLLFLANGAQYFFEKKKIAKGPQSRGPSAHPSGFFFRSSWVVVWGTVLTFVCMLRYWMRNVVPRGLQWNCNEVLDVRCTSAEFCSPCGVQQGAAIHAAYTAGGRSLCGIYDRSSAIHVAYTAGVPQSIRAFGRGLRSPCGYYFPIQNLENISLTRSSPSDSPRIRPRLSYASVRSME